MKWKIKIQVLEIIEITKEAIKNEIITKRLNSLSLTFWRKKKEYEATKIKENIKGKCICDQWKKNEKKALAVLDLKKSLHIMLFSNINS